MPLNTSYWGLQSGDSCGLHFTCELPRGRKWDAGPGRPLLCSNRTILTFLTGIGSVGHLLELHLLSYRAHSGLDRMG